MDWHVLCGMMYKVIKPEHLNFQQETFTLENQNHATIFRGRRWFLVPLFVCETFCLNLEYIPAIYRMQDNSVSWVVSMESTFMYSDSSPIDWFWLLGWLIHQGAVCTRIAPLWISTACSFVSCSQLQRPKAYGRQEHFN